MTGTNGRWPSAEFAVSTILHRDTFANARLHFVVRMATLLFLIALVGAAGVWVLMLRPPIYRYVMTDATGAVLPIIPTEKRNQSDEFVVKWTIDAITRLYSFDFSNYRGQLQDAQKNLTVVGWRDFEKSLERSGNFKAVIGNGYVTSAVPTGPGRITRADVHPTLGRFAWKVEFPMLVTFRSASQDRENRSLTANLDLRVSAVVIRQPEYLNPAGLGIRQIIAE